MSRVHMFFCQKEQRFILTYLIFLLLFLHHITLLTSSLGNSMIMESYFLPVYNMHRPVVNVVYKGYIISKVGKVALCTFL